MYVILMFVSGIAVWQSAGQSNEPRRCMVQYLSPARKHRTVHDSPNDSKNMAARQVVPAHE